MSTLCIAQASRACVLGASQHQTGIGTYERFGYSKLVHGHVFTIAAGMIKIFYG